MGKIRQVGAVVVAIVASVFLLLVFILRILKLKLLLQLQFSKDKKSLVLNAAIYHLQVLAYTFALSSDDNKHIHINYYKKGKLISVYTLRDIADRLKYFTQRFKKDFALAGHRTSGMFKKYLGKKSFAIERLVIEIELGFLDAYVTAMLNGSLYGLVNALLAVLYSAKGIPQKSSIEIKPDFTGDKFGLLFECLVSLPLTTAAALGLGLVFLFLRNKIRKEYRLQKEKPDGNPPSG